MFTNRFLEGVVLNNSGFHLFRHFSSETTIQHVTWVRAYSTGSGVSMVEANVDVTLLLRKTMD